MNKTILLFSLLIAFSIVSADTYQHTFSSGRAGNSNDVQVDLTTDLLSDVSASQDQTEYCAGSNAQLTLSLPLQWGGNVFSAVSYVPTNTQASGSGVLEWTYANWLSSSNYNNYIWYYDNCKYVSVWSSTYRCVNNYAGADVCGYLGNAAPCNNNIVSSATYSSIRSIMYKPNSATNIPGRGQVAAFCNGVFSANGVTGSISSSSTIITVPIPANQPVGTYTLPVSATYSCFFGAKEDVVVDGSSVSDQTTLYDHFSHTTTLNVPIQIKDCCTQTAALSIDCPGPITLDQNHQATIQLTLRNNGDVPITVNSISVSGGTFTSGQLPTTIAAHGSATITGTLSFSGSIPTSITFTASGTATVCGQQRTITATSCPVNIICTDSATLRINCPPSPVVLDANHQATMSLTITNTGNVSIVLNSITPSIGMFTPNTGQLPVSLSPGQSVQITGTYYYGGTTQVSVTFTASGTATVCGVPNTPVSVTTCTVTVTPCTDSATLRVDCPPSPIVLNSSNQAAMTLTITNTGNVPITLTSVSPSLGTFTPNAGQLPRTLAPGASAQITGVYYYGGTGQVSVTFTASGTATVCGVPNTPVGVTTCTVTVTPCSDIASMRVDCPPSPIVLDSNHQATITLTITNTGNVPITLTSVSPSIGTFTPNAGQLPRTLAPGASAQITGVYYYGGTTSVDVTFTASGTATVCGVPNTPVSVTTCTVRVNTCTDSATMRIDCPPSPIVLDSNHQATITLTITNTGNVPITLSSVTPNAGTFTPNAGQLPRTLAPGASAQITGVYYYGGATQAQITFTASGTATVCGVPNTPVSVTTCTVTVTPCTDSATLRIDCPPSPIVLDANHQATITLTITNTGNVPITLTSVSPSIGTFTPNSGQLPRILGPGDSAQITGVYYYGGTTQAQITFTASGTATVCGVPNTPVSVTTCTVTVTPCSDSATLRIDCPPSPIVLNSSNQAVITLTITNTGNVPIALASINPSLGTFTLNAGQLPRTLAPGALAQITGVYYYGGPSASIDVTFTASGTATVCGVPNTPVSVTTCTVRVNTCTDSATLRINCPPSPVLVNSSGQATMTLTINNTGNVPITLTSVSTSLGTFTPNAGQLPRILGPGDSVQITGVYYYGGTGQVSVTFTASGTATVCGVPNTPVSVTTCTVQVGQCPSASVDITGHSPTSITLSGGNQAGLTVFVQNNGTANLSITSFSANNGFTFTQDETLPIRLLPGQTHNFHGTARYTGGGTAPSSFTVTVFADAVDHFCGPDKVNDSESIDVHSQQTTDLQPRIDAPSRLSPTETGFVNVSARNTGTNDVDQTFYVNVTIRRCNGADCSAPIFRDSIPVDGLTAGNRTLVLQDYAIQCEQGWSSIFIEEWVDATDAVTETNENNNYDSATVGCAQENCVITGTPEIRTPGIYKFYASCFEGHQERNCSDMMGEYNFDWTYTPPSDTSFLEYRYNMPGYDYGANHENSTLDVIRIYSEGLLSVSARGRLREYQSSYLECLKIIPVYANPCLEQI